MEDQAANLLALLKKQSVAVDVKIKEFNSLKSSIKHLRVPEAAQATIFECIKIGITSQVSSSLVACGLSSLGHLIKRLQLQEQSSVIVAQGNKLLPMLLDRLGDARESHRVAAMQSLCELWTYLHDPVERAIRDDAMLGSNVRAKEMAMQWIVKMSKEEGLQFKSFVPYIVACLEDADGGVRDYAKHTVVELFRTAPEHAKTDLKKQMKMHNVRSSISNYILSQLGVPGAEVDMKASAMSASIVSSDLQPDAGFADSLRSEDSSSLQESAQMDPLYVHTERELNETFRNMQPCFEGKETEGNWMARDKNTTKIRRLIKGNAPSDFHSAFVAGVRTMLDGILKVANSLRTTMSTNGCHLIQDLARALGPAIDPMTEILLQSFIKMCAATKNIAAQNGNVTMDVIISNVSYNNRLMQHIWAACQDKNVQPRQFASGWLKTLIKKHASHRSQIEHSGGLDLIDKSIRKGLADANPKVREGMRGTYWAFSLMWPERAEAIMENLDAKSRGLLEKDPGNPNAPSSMASSFSNSVGATKKTITSKTSTRTALQEQIAAQRRAAAAAGRKLPDRPNSAQSAFSPVKQSSASVTNRAPSAMSASRPNVTSTSSTSAIGRSALGASSSSVAGPSSSLMSAPVRRPRRPELARPATADPYASRKPAKNVTPSMSPVNSPSKGTIKKSVIKDTTRKPTITQIPHSPTTSPRRAKSRADLTSHRKTPSDGQGIVRSPSISPSKAEDLTIVMPIRQQGGLQDTTNIPPRQRPAVEKNEPLDNAPTADDEGFTMVLPSVKLPKPVEDFTSPRGSPPKQLTPRRETPRRELGPQEHAENPNPFTVKLLSKNRSPMPKSPIRQEQQASDDEVKVYEDPFVANEEPPAPGERDEKTVLEELPINERSPIRRRSFTAESHTLQMEEDAVPQDEEAHRSPHKINNGNEVTQDRADTLRNRRLLTSGIERIRAKTLDAHGFRRLQDLVKSNQDIWGDNLQKFNDLLFALLDYLESPNDSLAPKASTMTPLKAQNLKTQTLATIRAMMTLYRKETSPHLPAILRAVLIAKKMFDSTSHMSSELEKTAEEAAKSGHPSDCLNAVLAHLESITTPSSPSPNPEPESSTDKISRSTTLALRTLALLLQSAHARKVNLSEEQVGRLGNVAVACLGDTDPDVRKADLEFCIELHERLGREEGFWKALGGAKEGHLNLITYYIAKRGRE
ncbi:hypothetical protein M501DRAFT_978278 [Patellaria atrata CBS 101060]|uniref:TOG domain-containing protein n=1 Tax=Patellaria atrata CBS 101060 TaxID=1346257 RepID=A0A9P4VPY8_9PEZI|nr:hypothetical protein M501DRAFT_978278 [Patellaria atrata CBS 101060]